MSGGDEIRASLLSGLEQIRGVKSKSEAEFIHSGLQLTLLCEIAAQLAQFNEGMEQIMEVLKNR